MRFRSNAVRVTATLLGASAAVLVTALPAAAAPTPRGDQFAVVDPSLSEYHGHVALVGAQNEAPTSLIGVGVPDGNTLHTYCVELTVSTKDGFEMKESPWADYPAG